VAQINRGSLKGCRNTWERRDFREIIFPKGIELPHHESLKRAPLGRLERGRGNLSYSENSNYTLLHCLRLHLGLNPMAIIPCSMNSLEK